MIYEIPNSLTKLCDVESDRSFNTMDINDQDISKSESVNSSQNIIQPIQPQTLVGPKAQESRPAFTVPLSLNLPWVPWDLRPAEPSSASRESLGFLI